MRYWVSIVRPNADVDIRWIGSMRSVELLVASLPPVTTTRYNVRRDVGRAWYVAVTPVSGKGVKGKTRFISPRAIIVPSVGELGYW